ncbi:MAG: hypothetical protein WCR55_05415 [Lentisphaerota bacterium]
MRKIFLLTFILFSSALLFGDDDIMAKVQQAIDPSGKLAKAETKITEGSLEMPQQNVKAEVKSYYKKPDKYRIDTTFEDGTKETRSFDGGKVLKWTSNSKKVEEAKGLDRGSFILNAKLQNPDMRVWQKEIFSSVTEDDSKIICVLKSEFAFKSPIVLYIDPDKYLVMKMDMPTSIGGKELEQSITIKNYKEENDVLFASEMSSSIFGAVIDYRIKDIRLNENIDDLFFTDLK